MKTHAGKKLGIEALVLLAPWRSRERSPREGSSLMRVQARTAAPQAQTATPQCCRVSV